LSASCLRVVSRSDSGAKVVIVVIEFLM